MILLSLKKQLKSQSKRLLLRKDPIKIEILVVQIEF